MQEQQRLTRCPRRAGVQLRSSSTWCTDELGAGVVRRQIGAVIAATIDDNPFPRSVLRGDLAPPQRQILCFVQNGRDDRDSHAARIA